MASTQLITDMKTVVNSGPSAVTSNNVTKQQGPIMDYRGVSRLALLKLGEASRLLKYVIIVTDPGDPNLTKLSAVESALEGGGSPTPSAVCVTDLKAVAALGPSALTKPLTSQHTGPIQDYLGNIKLAILKLQEAYTQCVMLVAVTDGGTDAANLALITSVRDTLV